MLVALAVIGPPPNTRLGVYLDPQVLLPAVLVLLFWGKLIFGLSKLPRSFMSVSVMFLAVLLLGLISSGLEAAGNIYGVLRLAKAFVVFLGMWAMITVVRDTWGITYIREKIPVWIYLVIGFNGLIMVAEFLSPAFYELVRRTTLAGAYTSILWDPSAEYRMPGLSLSGGAQISLFQSIGVLLFPLMVVSERRITYIAFYAFIFLVNLFCISISGRSGFYNLVLLAPVVAWLLFSGGHYIKFKAIWKQISALIIIVGFAVAVVGYAVFFTDEIERKFSSTLAIAISRNADFIAGTDSGLLQNSTVRTLWNDHLIFPSKVGTWILGDPSVMEDRGVERSLDSDIGYIVMLNAFGLFSGILQFLINFIPLFIAIRYRKHSFGLGYATIVVTSSILFFNAKEVMFFTRMAWPLQLVLWCSFAYSLEEFRANRALGIQRNVSGRFANASLAR